MVLTWGHGVIDTSLTGHEYRRRTFTAGAWGAWGEWTPIFSSGTGGINFESHTVSRLDTEVTYGFELRAVDGQAKGVAASAEATTFVPMSVTLCCNSPTTFDPAERLRLTFEFSHRVGSLGYFDTSVDYEGVFLDFAPSLDPAWGRNPDAGERGRFWNLDVTPNVTDTITVTLQGSSPATRCTASDQSDKDRFCSSPPDNLPLGEDLVVTLVLATPQNDATLSALSLGTGVTLSPSFAAAGTASYTASVAHAVEELTLTPTKGNDGAEVAYLDENDREIADADGVEDGHQVALAVGQNVIKVRVTSQDGSMTRTYTVTVTRAAELPELSVANAAAAEGDDVTFTVTLSPAATEDVTATWTASIGSGDTAVAADLGSTTTGTLTFTAGDTEERFTVATAEDELDEENETFTVTLSSPSSNAMLATDPTATGTITAADALPNTAPVITTTSPVAVAENGTSVATLAATDADRDPIAWSKTGGADADGFALSAQGVLTFKAEPDYESPADVASADPANDAENNEYVVFVTASDGTDAAELQLVVRVTNANDAPTGTVTIDDTSPMIGDVLTASAAAVADQDGLPDPFAPAWQWYRTPTDGSETEIDRATAATYTVVAADYGATLTAKATWTDNGGFTNTLASAATDETPRPSCTQTPGDVWCGVVTVEWYEPLSSYGYAPAFRHHDSPGG